MVPAPEADPASPNRHAEWGAQLRRASVVTSLTSGFGFNINVAVTNDPNGINSARTYDTDHQGPPDEDLQWSGPGARCAACQGQDLILVIEGTPNFAVEGESPRGG